MSIKFIKILGYTKSWCKIFYARMSRYSYYHIAKKDNQEQPARDVLCNFIEIVLLHECSPVNLLHLFRTPFSKNISGCLLLENWHILVWVYLYQNVMIFSLYILLTRTTGILCYGGIDAVWYRASHTKNQQYFLINQLFIEQFFMSNYPDAQTTYYLTKPNFASWRTQPYATHATQPNFTVTFKL